MMNCSNCKTTLTEKDNYCPNCGQRNRDINLSIWDLLLDFLGDYFSFDSKLFRTIKPLVFSPGKVPLDFVEGKRAYYIPPLRTFIFLSFVTFFIWGSISVPSDFDDSSSIDIVEPKSLLDQYIDSVTASFFIPVTIRIDTSLEDSAVMNSIEYLFSPRYPANEVVDSLAPEVNPLVKFTLSQMLQVFRQGKQSSRDYFLSNLPIALLLLQPFVALLLLIFYKTSEHGLFIQHLIFSVYFHSFVLILGILNFILMWFVDSNIALIISSILLAVYLFFSMQRFYQQGFLRTVFIWLGIVVLYVLIILPSFALSFFLFGFLLY